MIDKIYWDTFAEQYVSEEFVKQNETAPPERFLPVYRGDMGVYIEHWIVSSDEGDRLDIAYTKDERRMREMLIESKAKLHNCKLIQLSYWTIPSELFDECLKTMTN